MQIIEQIKKIQEAAKRQGIVVTDILSNGTVVSDLPAYHRTYHLNESINEADEEKEDRLEMDDEKMKTKYDNKEASATAIVDNIIKGDFESALEALNDYKKLHQTDKEDKDSEDDSEDDADEDGEMSGIDKDYMMPASSDDENDKDMKKGKK